MEGTVLIVDDDQRLCRMLKEYLESNGLSVVVLINGDQLEAAIAARSPDIIILDIMLPGKDGLEVLKDLRGSHATPVIMLTAKGEDTDRIVGLELGADDYLAKPFNPRELLARIKALLRRADRVDEKKAASPVTVEALTLDPSRREARLQGRAIDLTTVEFDLLWYLVTHVGTVVSRNDIHLALYNTEYDGLDRSIDVYISRLRHKLGDQPSDPQYLKTVRGVGYLFAGGAS